MSANKASPEDVFVWPDGTWCFRGEYWEMPAMFDDFYVLFENSEKWEAFLLKEGYC